MRKTEALERRGRQMRLLVTGVSGQLGHDVMNELIARGHQGVGSATGPVYAGAQDGSAVCTAPYASLNLCDKDAVEAVVQGIQPDAVIHCAAWTDVDGAEDEENRERVRAINAGGTENLARACARRGCKMLYISTDYVFDGEGTAPWTPECREYKPLNFYGQTKLEGELAAARECDKLFIVRTAWVFGANGKNFVRTMLRLSENYDTLRVVNDQIGAPTYTRDLARLLVDMAETEKYGRYHATNEGGYISWYDFACEIFRQAGRKVAVIPVSTEEYGRSRAARPRNSRLDTGRIAEAGFAPLPAWQDALGRYLKEIGVS